MDKKTLKEHDILNGNEEIIKMLGYAPYKHKVIIDMGDYYKDYKEMMLYSSVPIPVVGDEDDGFYLSQRDWFYNNSGKYFIYQDFSQNWSLLMNTVTFVNGFSVSVRPFVFGKPEGVNLRILEDRVTLKGMFWSNKDTVSGNHWENLKPKPYKSKDPKERVFMALVDFARWYNNLNDKYGIIKSQE